jgi:hypothetical protein
MRGAQRSGGASVLAPPGWTMIKGRALFGLCLFRLNRLLEDDRIAPFPRSGGMLQLEKILQFHKELPG